MKRVKILMMAAAAAVLAAPCVMANDVVLRVQVPFDFMVGDRHLPSGEYKFVQEQDPRLVRIYSEGREQLAVALWHPVAPGATGNGELVFHKHGGQHFLKMIRASNGSGVSLPETRLERKAQAGSDSVVVAGMR
jgi:hypothetical protein